MSKTKTKRARRDTKREESRKVAAHHRKSTTTSKPSAKLSNAPASKKQKQTAQPTNPEPTAKPHIQASQRHDIPFEVYDNILLVGEGDFSFARSLVIEHGCANVTATSFDSEEEVRQKYTNFEAIHKELSDLTPPVPFHHSIDATKLSGYKNLKTAEGQPWDTIAFMFPHTGGLSTDVNRQVRANQALLVSFFKSCLQISDKKMKQEKDKPRSKRKATTATEFLKIGGKVVVTLFEGEPYTLWNVRDLARHAGLRVVESFKFDWEQYPGYCHVRTLGTLEGGGGWKGEDRAARMYVFEKMPLKDDDDDKQKSKKGKKRSREDVSDSDED